MGIYGQFGIDGKIEALGAEVEAGLKSRFERIDANAEFNQLKVIKAMQDSRVSEACLGTTTGYGYNDIGRDCLEKVYAAVFKAEAAIVRPLIACGTHAIAIALFGNLRPGDELLAVSGRPYDTLEEVIGIRPSNGSLMSMGVTYREVPLKDDGSFDLEAIKAAVSGKTKMVHIQRSKGYSSRPSLTVEQIGEAIAAAKSVKEDVICFVDNCYGEFVERTEPIEAGADLIAGSLIKNPGGGLAPVGGYVAGRAGLVENASYRMTCPGLGAEVGPSLGVNPAFFQGLFLAPTVTASALKGAIFAAACYERLGFEAFPKSDAERTDIIEAVTLKSPEALIAFCQGIQAASPVDSHVVPEPWPMPGYSAPVIMAAGAFVSGSSIELSADGPLREPYTAFFQGGLTWPSAKLGILNSMEMLRRKGLIVL